jgi:hypothetical protein
VEVAVGGITQAGSIQEVTWLGTRPESIVPSINICSPGDFFWLIAKETEDRRQKSTTQRGAAVAADRPLVKTGFQTLLYRRLTWSFLLAFCLVMSGGGWCATHQGSVQGAGQNPALAAARLSLAEARKTGSDSKIAVANYLAAADLAAHAAGTLSGAEVDEARLIYNTASQEATVLLRSSAELWNRTETIASSNGIYRLSFAKGSQNDGTWDPGYFDFFRTPRQVHEKVAHQEVRSNDWGGVLVGVYKSSDPRKYFLPRVGLAVPVTTAFDFAASGTGTKRERNATLALYDPTRREMVRVGGVQRPLAADFGAALAYYPDPKLTGLMAMFRPANYEQRGGLFMLEPYDPDRIPVVFVHGLMSTPQMWEPTISR